MYPSKYLTPHASDLVIFKPKELETAESGICSRGRDRVRLQGVISDLGT